MYTSYYNLTSMPFDLNPDPGMLFLSDTHKEALATLQYALMEKKWFLVLTGEVGTGKTTLVQVFLQSLAGQTRYCLLSNPSLKIEEFYYYISHCFGLDEFDGNKAKFLLSFAELLKQAEERGKMILLLIDEAHVLPVELLEEVRLLSNANPATQTVLTIFLVGQPELNEHLAHERLLPLRQRISLRFHLHDFTGEETEAYIHFRLQKAGARRLDIFTNDALSLIHQKTGGNPRLVNLLCDHCLISGFSEGKPVVDQDIVRSCVAELHSPGHQIPRGGEAKKSLLRKLAGL